MARLGTIDFPELDWESGDVKDVWAEQDRALKELERKAKEAKAAGNPVGTLLYFGVADGHAIYVVTKAKPLTIAHVPYGDAYRIPGAHVRGINMTDVLHAMRLPG